MNASTQQDFENILMMRSVESRSKLTEGQYTRNVYSTFIPSVRHVMSSVTKFINYTNKSHIKLVSI
jgi:hypothetical protein